MNKIVKEALTFDDVLLIPAASDVLPYGHIFMNYSDAAFARHGNCKLAFRYRIHRHGFEV